MLPNRRRGVVRVAAVQAVGREWTKDGGAEEAPYQQAVEGPNLLQLHAWTTNLTVGSGEGKRYTDLQRIKEKIKFIQEKKAKFNPEKRYNRSPRRNPTLLETGTSHDPSLGISEILCTRDEKVCGERNDSGGEQESTGGTRQRDKVRWSCGGKSIACCQWYNAEASGCSG